MAMASKLLSGTRNKSGNARNNVTSYWTAARSKRKGPWTGFRSISNGGGYGSFK
jgi:hypothetical protein